MSAVSLIRGSLLKETKKSKAKKKKGQRKKERAKTETDRKRPWGGKRTVHFQSWPHNQTHKYSELAKTSTLKIMELKPRLLTELQPNKPAYSGF